MSSTNIIPLESLRIARPCRADWDAMTGDDRARFCGSCHKNVYDLSGMTRVEAEALIREKEGNLCLRLHRREDGTVITSDCPVGVTQARRPFWWLSAAFAAFTALGMGVFGRQAEAGPKCADSPVRMMGKVAVTLGEPAAMGNVAVVPTPVATPKSNSKKQVRKYGRKAQGRRGR